MEMVQMLQTEYGEHTTFLFKDGHELFENDPYSIWLAVLLNEDNVR
jgi:hypothetical protein